MSWKTVLRNATILAPFTVGYVNSSGGITITSSTLNTPTLSIFADLDMSTSDIDVTTLLIRNNHTSINSNNQLTTRNLSITSSHLTVNSQLVESQTLDLVCDICALISSELNTTLFHLSSNQTTLNNTQLKGYSDISVNTVNLTIASSIIAKPVSYYDNFSTSSSSVFSDYSAGNSL